MALNKARLSKGPPKGRTAAFGYFARGPLIVGSYLGLH